MGKYYVVYYPATYDLMSLSEETCKSPLDIVGYLTRRDASNLNEANDLGYLRFDLQKLRAGIVDTVGIENGAAVYVGNQIGRLAPTAQVVQADDVRRTIPEIIERRGTKPQAIFMTCLSSNFPGAVAAAIVLNRAQIPVNHISLMPHCFGAEPGAQVFQESLAAGTFFYGEPGTMDYLRTLCIADHGEMNMIPPEGVRKSPLLVGIMALQALRRVGKAGNALRNGVHMGLKAYSYPTARGRKSCRERVEDSFSHPH